MHTSILSLHNIYTRSWQPHRSRPSPRGNTTTFPSLHTVASSTPSYSIVGLDTLRPPSTHPFFTSHGHHDFLASHQLDSTINASSNTRFVSRIDNLSAPLVTYFSFLHAFPVFLYLGGRGMGGGRFSSIHGALVAFSFLRSLVSLNLLNLYLSSAL